VPGRGAVSHPTTGGGRRAWLGTAATAASACVTALTAVVGIGGSAVAVPMPTVTQVQHKLAKLNAKVARLGQQYDQVLAQLSQANQRLAFLGKQTARYRGHFDAMQREVGRLATAAYEEGGATSPVALLTSSSPQQVLDQSAILSEISTADESQIRQYLAASRQLVWAQRVAKTELAQISQLRRSLHKHLAKLKSLQATEQALFNELSPSQQSGLGPGGGNQGGGNYKSNGTQASNAVAFAYGQLGCPYYYGGTGPCHDPGFDCSGLMMAAWGAAGVTIPRVSWDQMGLPGVKLVPGDPTKYLRPGDILGFAGNSHVGMYVGGGYLIDAPVPGAVVEKVALAGWYLANLDGAVRP
jgi:peptidoglycan DL-endopeptidase CwlO